ncbi:MAG: SDR family oxidoreductase [Burkholderiaceae bacterium]
MARRRFDGKVVVVTGAAGGLGRALALRFGAAGAKLGLLDRDGAGLADTATLLREATAPPTTTAVCDVTDASACADAIATVRRQLGAIDVLINNAGISHRSAFVKTDLAVIRRVMEVNFFGALHCTHAALPDLIAQRGQLIVISSVAGFAPLLARTGYAASKHALHGFFDSLRSEVEPQGVGVLLVCPSFIATGIEKNALAGDGAPVRHAQAIVGVRASADDMAAQIHDAAAAGRRLLLPGRTAKLAWWVSRLAPRRYERIMAARMKAELGGE